MPDGEFSPRTWGLTERVHFPDLVAESFFHGRGDWPRARGCQIRENAFSPRPWG